MTKLRVNRKDYTVDVSSDTPLLWVLRETIGLTGTKFGCGIGMRRGLHRSHRRQAGAIVPGPGEGRPREEHIHDRGNPGKPSCQKGVARGRRIPVRLVPTGPDHGGGGPAEGKAETHGRRHRQCHGDESLPLRDLPAHSKGHSPGGRDSGERRKTMNEIINLSRRSFLRKCAGRRRIWSWASIFRSPISPGRKTAGKSGFPKRLYSHRPRWIGDHYRQQIGDGTGGLHLPADARRRGTGLRLEKVRVEAAPVDPVYNHTGLGSPGDRRQHQRPDRMGAAVHGRGDGPGDAHCRRGEDLEGGPGRLPGRDSRGESSERQEH